MKTDCKYSEANLPPQGHGWRWEGGNDNTARLCRGRETN